MKQSFNPEQVEKRIEEVRAELKKFTDRFKDANYGEHAQMLIQCHVAELHTALSERAEIASQRLERLTWALTWLTVVLAILTALLCYKEFSHDASLPPAASHVPAKPQP